PGRHPPPTSGPLDPDEVLTDFPTVTKVLDDATNGPIQHEREEDDENLDLPTPLPAPQRHPPLLVDEMPQPADPQPIEQPQHRRSARIPIPTAKVSTDPNAETNTERAVQESKEAGERVHESCAERRRMLDGLHERQGSEARDVIPGDPDLDRVLAALITPVEGHPDLDPTELDAE
ncbi:hypothetical protein DXG01_015034, partial [Tephrocybe rancida]